MTHQVSLSSEAYRALRRTRRANESFSDVVLRLLREQRARERDPWSFVRSGKGRPAGLARRLDEVERWRDAERLDAPR